MTLNLAWISKHTRFFLSAYYLLEMNQVQNKNQTLIQIYFPFFKESGLRIQLQKFSNLQRKPHFVT